jgi:hypothetical protein
MGFAEPGAENLKAIVDSLVAPENALPDEGVHSPGQCGILIT